MKWDEFKDMLSGLGPDTPLGRIVAIRSEDDPEVLKNFSSEQKTYPDGVENKNSKGYVSGRHGGIFRVFKAGIDLCGGR